MQELQDLIRKLLVGNPARRLGVLKNGADGVRLHPWFADFDWAAFADCSLPAPYIPKVLPPRKAVLQPVKCRITLAGDGNTPASLTGSHTVPVVEV